MARSNYSKVIKTFLLPNSPSFFVLYVHVYYCCYNPRISVRFIFMERKRNTCCYFKFLKRCVFRLSNFLVRMYLHLFKLFCYFRSQTIIEVMFTSLYAVLEHWISPWRIQPSKVSATRMENNALMNKYIYQKCIPLVPVTKTEYFLLFCLWSLWAINNNDNGDGNIYLVQHKQGNEKSSVQPIKTCAANTIFSRISNDNGMASVTKRKNLSHKNVNCVCHWVFNVYTMETQSSISSSIFASVFLLILLFCSIRCFDIVDFVRILIVSKKQTIYK